LTTPCTTYVYITLGSDIIPAGRLDMVREGKEAFARFRYGRRYLLRRDALALDPVQLPLPQNPEHDFVTPEGFDLFGGIRDAVPDGWGRHLMDRASGKLLEEFDYLVATSDDRVGALSFGADLTGPKRITPWTENPPFGEVFDLQAMLEAVQDLDRAEDLAPEHQRFLLRGSSLGGARPKATTNHQNGLWIAKFGRAADRYPVCRAEYAVMRLAALVGLDVPAVDCVSILGQDVYLIKRFDRLNSEGTQRLPFVSGLTLLGLHESESARGSYRALVEALRRYGSSSLEDGRELWKRMIFNILCNNTDDHLRNHGFLWDTKGNGWRLSPLYDVVPFPQLAHERYLAIGVGTAGRLATLRNALSEASSFALSPHEAFGLASTMQQQVKAHRRQVFQEAGLSAGDIMRLESCFLACEEPLAADDTLSGN
jgi:serine/threonine-protein kinase HipA